MTVYTTERIDRNVKPLYTSAATAVAVYCLDSQLLPLPRVEEGTGMLKRIIPYLAQHNALPYAEKLSVMVRVGL